jgi:hypothetical protein
MSEPPAELLARIADGIEAIERTVGELRPLQDVSRAAYKSDDNRIQRDAVERKFEKLTRRGRRCRRNRSADRGCLRS